MLYSTFQAPKAWTRHLSVLLFALSLIVGPFVHAQTPPVNAWFTPSEFESGDELTLHVDYGSSEIPVPATTYMELTFAYEGFDIVSQPVMDIDDSWFCEDGNCDATISFDNETRELKVTISRTDGRAVGGYGSVGRGKGIIIEMVEIQMKKEAEPIKFLPSKSHLNIVSPIKITYDFQRRSIKIIGTYLDSIKELSVIDSNGKLIFRKVGEIETLTPIELEKNKLYFIRLVTREGVSVKKFLIK